jgi:hypothetical protein
MEKDILLRGIFPNEYNYKYQDKKMGTSPHTLTYCFFTIFE